ncbi:MAG: cytochrome bc complex cytochrome b subunit [Thermoplasmata archaeon]|nr:cytochrome bc complex cytochrome b subunit [Thermoplasmata archaeon]
MSFSSWYNRSLNKVWGFVEDRTAMKKWALRPQPEFTFKPSYWTGSFVAVALSYQIISGALLLLYYQPSTNPTLTACGQAVGSLSSAPAAWCSTYYIVNSVPMGQLLLSSHLYGAYAMIFLMFVHFFRGYYVGVYKSPREFSWMVGTLLMVVTMGMGFTGYLLPYTQISYNATNVGVVLALRLPTVGPLLGPFILADGTSQGLLSRMFDAHVILLPIALAGLFYAHFALFESHGIAPPATSDPLQRRRFTEKEEKGHVPFIPHVLLYTMKWGLLYVGILFGIAALWPWNLPTYVGNTAAAAVVTEPDWYFLWVFKLVDFAGVTPVIAIGVTNVLLVYILFLPFLDRSKRTHPRDRPFFIYLATCMLGFLILMTVWGGETPGVQITDPAIAMTLGPIFAVNAVVVALFHYRYHRSYQRRLAARKSAFAGNYPRSVSSRAGGPAAAAEVRGVE